jgi:flagellar hook protein FlgE
MVGGGVRTVGRQEVTLQGALQTTGTTTDLAINGQGFFLVSDSAGRTLLTRAGHFVADAQGRLVNAAGYYLMGYATSSGSSGALSVVTIEPNKMYASPTTKGNFSANLPANANVSLDLPSVNSATAQFSGKSSMTVYDNLGNPVVMDVYFAKTNANEWEMTAYNHADASPSGGFPYASGALAVETLTFDAADGALMSPTSTTLAVPNGGSMTLDLSKMVQLGAAYTVTNVYADGYAASTIGGISIGKDGTLNYQLSNGQFSAAYDIPLGKVASPTNLTGETGNVFSVNSDSGQMFIGTAGTEGFGEIHDSTLENSTVDLASQLASMIVAQRSFTANSQVFQVASEIMQVLNNLK